MTALLKGYFPQVLDWFDKLTTFVACDFILSWPTLEDAKRARKTTLLKFLHDHNSVRKETNARRVAEIKGAMPLTTDRAVIRSSVLYIKGLCEQMKATLTAIHEVEAEITQLFTTHKDYEIFDSLPGAGPALAPRLCVAFGSDRKRWERVEDILCFSGVAPVIERSGKQMWTRWRYLCPKFLRQSFVEYAAESVNHSFWAKAMYKQLRSRGKSHQAAVRALAFKWIRVIWKCWRERRPYDEVRYLESLRKKGSPLLSLAAADRS